MFGKDEILHHLSVAMHYRNVYHQEIAKKSLTTAVRNNRLSHALLFRGIGGVGKLPLAIATGQYINCLEPSAEDSCGNCANCRKIAQGIHPDVHFILPIIAKSHGGESFTTDDYLPVFREHFFKNPYLSLAEWAGMTDAENKQISISIAEIRALRRKVELKAFEAPYKVVIIWHVEKIRTEAANAFLKLLEEPPENTVILMTTEDTTQILPTILSRCQIVPTHRIPQDTIKDVLINEHHIEYNLADELAHLSGGSLSKALDMAQHSQSSYALSFMEWMRECYKPNPQLKKMMEWADELAKQPKEYHKLYFEYALQKLRDALMFYVQTPEIAFAAKNERDFLEKFGASLDLVRIEKARVLIEQTQYYITRNANTYAVLLDACLQLNKIFQMKG